MTSPILIICNDEAAIRLKTESNLPDDFWLDVLNLENVPSLEQFQFVRCHPELLDSELSVAQTDRAKVLFLQFTESLIVYLDVDDTNRFRELAPSWIENFATNIRKIADDRSGFLSQVLVKIQSHAPIPLNDHVQTSSKNFRAGIKSIFLMGEEFERSEEHNPVFSKYVWPVAVGNLLLDFRARTRTTRDLNGVFLWRHFVLLPELSPRSRNEFLTAWTDKLKHKLKQPPSVLTLPSGKNLPVIDAITKRPQLPEPEFWFNVDVPNLMEQLEAVRQKSYHPLPRELGQKLVEFRSEQTQSLNRTLELFWQKTHIEFNEIFTTPKIDHSEIPPDIPEKLKSRCSFFETNEPGRFRIRRDSFKNCCRSSNRHKIVS